MSRRTLRLASLALLAVALLGAAPRTNVLLIVVDDLGWHDLGVYGNGYHETPRIDALAAQGARFTDFYAASPVCSPSRASILTGLYPARIGMTEFTPGQWRPFERLIVPPPAREIPGDVPTLGELFSAAGYATGWFGKWHVGREQRPSDRGFAAALTAGGQHFAPGLRTIPPTEVPEGTYLTDLLTDLGIEFLETHRGEPFLLVISHVALHPPLQAKAETIARYAAKGGDGPGRNPRYAAMLDHVDESVGRLRSALESLGLADETAIVLTSDNGASLHHFLGIGDPLSTNEPLRDGKGTLFEGGIRVPLIVLWPGHTTPGAVVHEPTITNDLLPTLLDVAGIAPPAETLDGTSLAPLLEGRRATLGREALYFHYPHYHHARPAGAVRAGNLKLIEYFDDWAVELYDLAADPSESDDLADRRPADVVRLRALLGDWRRSVDAPMPRKNPEYDPARAGEWWLVDQKRPFDLDEERRRLEPWKYRGAVR